MKYDVPRSTKKAASLLLNSIVNHYGGFTDAAILAGLSKQHIYSFIKYGYVPLGAVYSLARKFKVSVFALSYVKLMEALGESTTSFETVVNDVKFLSKEDKDRVLKVYNK